LSSGLDFNTFFLNFNCVFTASNFELSFTTNQSNDIEPSEILNDNSNTVIEYKIGQNVAVAYMDVWYPGSP
jgi:hypothetical protein